MSTDTTGPHGTVAVTFSSDAARYSGFTADLAALKLPPGSVMDCEFGMEAWELRNKLVQRAIERGSYWVWFITEDFSFPPEIVETLVSREQPIMAPIVLSRSSPFHPQCYTHLSRASERVPLLLNSVVGPGSLVEIESAVSSGLLVRRAVFQTMQKDWFAPGDESDLDFCDRARAQGFDAFVDTSMRLGNRCTASMQPVYRGDKWTLGISVNNEAEFTVPLNQG